MGTSVFLGGKTTNNRKSNFELLRVIAAFLIVLNHSAPFYGGDSPSHINYMVGQENWHYAFLMIYDYFGQIGDCVFFCLSAYFLHKKSRRDINKVAYIVFDSLFFSLFYIIVFSMMGKHIGKLEIIRNIFSIACSKEWFVGCYLLLYISFPFLNIIIDKCEKKSLLSLCITLFCLYSIISTGTIDYKYSYSRIIGAYEVYFIMAYICKYLSGVFDSRRNLVKMIIISAIGIAISMIFGNYISISLPGFSSLPSNWCYFINPFIISISISLVFYFKKLNVRQNGIINYLSSLSLLFYLIYEDYIFRNNFKPLFWEKLYELFSYKYIIVMTFAVGVCAYILIGIIAVIYKNTLQPYVHCVGKEFFSLINKYRHIVIDQISEL